MIFVEFVPVTDDSKELAPDEKEREYLKGEIARLRSEHPEMVYISFPGDEKSSDINVRDTSLRDAMNSRLFREVRDGGYLLEDHPGGCTLYERRADVERIMAEAD